MDESFPWLENLWCRMMIFAWNLHFWEWYRISVLGHRQKSLDQMIINTHDIVLEDLFFFFNKAPNIFKENLTSLIKPEMEP